MFCNVSESRAAACSGQENVPDDCQDVGVLSSLTDMVRSACCENPDLAGIASGRYVSVVENLLCLPWSCWEVTSSGFGLKTASQGMYPWGSRVHLWIDCLLESRISRRQHLPTMLYLLQMPCHHLKLIRVSSNWSLML